MTPSRGERLLYQVPIRTLIDALITVGITARACEWCRGPFLVGPGHGKVNKRCCTQAHAGLHAQRKRRAKAALLADLDRYKGTGRTVSHT